LLYLADFILLPNMFKRLCVFTFISLGLATGSTLRAQLTANFKANKLSGCSPVGVQFTDLSTGSGIVSWSWTFGDGNSSTQQNPFNQYIKSNTYTVTLTVKNSSGTSNTITKTAYITVFADPVADFTANDSIGCAPFTVNFKDLSIKGSGTITSWNWNFSDGSPVSTSQNPTHTFLAGKYGVTLIVTDANGCQSSIIKDNYIVVSASSLNPGFTVSPTIGCHSPATINFTNTTSGGNGITYLWSFGDAHTSVAINPANTYASPGTYTVIMTASSNAGCSKTDSAKVTVLGADNVKFVSSATSVCQGSTIQFTDSTKPKPGSWSWSFGDGGTSSSENPSHKYNNSGTYSVKLKVVFDGLCNDSVIENNYITVNPNPVVSFSADTTRDCTTPLTVQFSDNTNGASAWAWSFPNGSISSSTSRDPDVTYNSPGLYNVKLVVTSVAGCKDSLTKTNYIQIVPPVANFSTTPKNGCVPLTVSFKDQSTSSEPITKWKWSFGDGNSSSGQNPVNTYIDTGKYTVVLKITNSYGCTASDSIVNDVVVTNKPLIGFYASTLQSCALTPILFTDTSKVSTNWIWNFGDKNTETGVKDPTHIYSDTGLFVIKEIVFNVGCPDTLVKLNYIHVSPAVPRFSYTPKCDSVLTRTFINSSIGASKWYWNFGDGSKIDSLDFNVTHTFQNPGTYTVTLTALNTSSGCKKDTTLQIVLIDLIPNFTLTSPAKGCNPLTVGFSNETTGGTPENYLWTFGDGTDASGVAKTSNTYTSPGLYTVKLYVTDAFGCKDSVVKTDTIQVFNINPLISVDFQAGCDSLQVAFRDSSVLNPVATNWTWIFGDGDSSHLQNPTHYYENVGSYSVTLIVGNIQGACSITETNLINFAKPIPSFSVNDTIACPGSPLTFSNLSSNSNKYKWFFGDGSFLSTTQQILLSHSYASNGVYSIKLIATDTVKGCSDSLTKTKLIYIDKPVGGFTTSSTTKACPPLSVTFVDTSRTISGITSQYWNFGNGNLIESGLGEDSASFTYNNPGLYSVELIVSDAAGCSDTITKTKLITVNGPTGSYVWTPLSGCVPLTIDFTLTVFNTKADTLAFGDGIISVHDTCCIIHQYNSSGTYYPSLVLYDSLGCHWIVPTKNTILVTPYPNPNFNNVPLYPKAGVSVQFTDASSSATSWIWNFGDTTSASTEQNPVHSYKYSGIYFVKEVVNNGGCVDSITKEITVIADLILPNVFSPNGDGVNDTFDVGAYGFTQIDIKIFDRWGVNIFSKNAQNIYWDGHTTAGLEASPGIYFYTVVATPISGANSVLKGFVELVR
jgi:gliding motility-associated-like protein